MSNIISTPSISTILAELHVIQIGKKQMTISVFNQLYESDKCYDDDLNIIYPIWGKINREIEWVIFQKNNELRKQEMPLRRKPQMYNYIFAKYIKDNHESRLNMTPSLSNLLFRISRHLEIRYSDIEELKKDLDKSICDLIDEQFQKDTKYIFKWNEMVGELQSSRQLFIAL